MNMHLTLNAHFKGVNNPVRYMYLSLLDKNRYLLTAILGFILRKIGHDMLQIIEYNVLNILLHLTLTSEVFSFPTKTIGHFSHS